MSKVKEKRLSYDWIADDEKITVEKEIQFYQPIYKIFKNGKLMGCVKPEGSGRTKLFGKKAWAYSPLRGDMVSPFPSFETALHALYDHKRP